MLIAQDLIWFASDAGCTWLNLYLSAYLPKLTLDCQFFWNSSFSKDFKLFQSFFSLSKIFLTLLLIPNLLALIFLFQYNHIFDTVSKCHAMSLSCMILHGWNVRVLNPFFIFFLLFYPIFPLSSSAFTSWVNFFDLLCFFRLLFLKNILAPMLSCEVIFLSLETNIIWFSHCRKYRIPL